MFFLGNIFTAFYTYCCVVFLFSFISKYFLSFLFIFIVLFPLPFVISDPLPPHPNHLTVVHVHELFLFLSLSLFSFLVLFLHTPNVPISVSLFSVNLSLFCMWAVSSLDSTFEWNHMVIVFLWLNCFI